MKRLLLTVAVALGTAFVSTAQIQNYSVGQTVNDFTVTDIHGNTHTLSTITGQGKWVVIDFFFTTCPPCQATVPIFSELHQKYGCNSGDLFCISIDTGDSDADVEAFENTYSTSSGHAPAPAVSGTEGGGNAVIADFSPAAYPTYCIIDPNMKIQNVDVWPINDVATFESALTSAGATLTPMACPLAVEEVEMALNDAKLFPNPAVSNTTLSVELESNMSVDVKIYTMLGAEVSSVQFVGTEGSNDFALETEGLAEGQYVVSVSLGDVATRQLSLSVLK